MTDLIVMTKAGEPLAVHPTCVADHQRMGWAVCAVKDLPTAELAPDTAQPQPKPKRSKQTVN